MFASRRDSVDRCCRSPNFGSLKGNREALTETPERIGIISDYFGSSSEELNFTIDYNTTKTVDSIDN